MMLLCWGTFGWLSPRAEAGLISRRQEIRIGEEVAREMEAKHGLSRNPVWAARLTAVGERLARVNDRPHMPYRFRVLRMNDVNAFALPGGFIYATEGLFNFIGNDDQMLAGVIAHEVGHVARKHVVEIMEKNLAMDVMIGIFAKDRGDQQLGALSKGFVLNGFSRDQEMEADRLGIRYSKKAGYDPRGILNFLVRLRQAEKESGRGGLDFLSTFLSTHPPTKDRIDAVEEELRTIR